MAKVSVIFAFVLLSSVAASAHQSDVSTLLVIQEKSGFTIILESGLAGFQAEIKNAGGHYSTKAELSEALEQHVLEHLHLKVEGKEIPLTLKRSALGHATKVVLLAKHEGEVRTIEVINTVFQHTHRSQSGLTLKLSETKPFTTILRKKTKFATSLYRYDGRLFPKKDSEMMSKLF